MGDTIEIVQGTATTIEIAGLQGPQGPAGAGGSGSGETATFDKFVADVAGSSNPTNINSALGYQIPTPALGGQSAVGLLGYVSGGSARARIYGAGTGGTILNFATFGSDGVTINQGPLRIVDSSGGETGSVLAADQLSANRNFNFVDASGELAVTTFGDTTITPFPHGTGSVGNFLYSETGHLYFCFAPNRWGRFTISTGLAATVYQVTGSASTDTITAPGMASTEFANGARVRFIALNGGTGLALETDYFVINRNTGSGTFQLAATSGGSAINFTTDIVATSTMMRNAWI